MNLADRLETKADMINMGERIEWGSDQLIMREAAYCIRQFIDIIKTQHEALEQAKAGWAKGTSTRIDIDEALTLSASIVKGVL